MKRFALAIALACVLLSGSALAGDMHTGGDAPAPADIHTPGAPAPGDMLTPGAAAPGDGHSVDELSVILMILDLVF